MDQVVHRTGRIAAAATALLTLVAFAIAILTPPRSGPSCSGAACVGYPYTDIATFFPRDYLWMAPASLLLLTLLCLAACIHAAAGGWRQVYSLLGLVLAATATAILGLDYFLQFAVVQPSVLRGEFEGIALLSQYNPHGVFIALESLGYLVLCVALGCLALGLRPERRTVRVAQWVFAAASVVALASFAGLSWAYGHDIEYRFEIAVISVAWTALAAGCSLIALGWHPPAEG